MELNDINRILSQLADDKANGRNHILALTAALIDWMGLQFVENNIPRLLDFQTIKLKEALVGAPVTGQEQLYRLTAENQPVRIRFAVFKKYDKKMIHYLVDGNVGLASYQAAMRGIKQIEGREPYITRQPYFIHFVTTAKYDRLWVVFNDGEQKRVLVFRNRLTQTQFSKIMPAWHNIAAKSKPEMAKLFWFSLDVKEVNKDFYKNIKERFDALIAIAQIQASYVDENTIKQFAVRLIGRYIFCWFLKEKEIIPEALIASKTIEKYQRIYFQQCLGKLFFNTLNAEVTDRARNLAINDDIDVLYKNIPYLNGGLFDWHPEDELFEKLDLNAWLIDFVKVLESFDFTVDESNSQYQQVAIDPEMLGRIFENLLASQNPDTEKMANQRKAFGAFYTPREIVDYMVNESLKAYLENQLLPKMPEQACSVQEQQAVYNEPLFQHLEPPKPIPIDVDKSLIADIERRRERIKTKIDKLFVPDCADNPFDKEETIQARKALSEITILDPACGSGAFPMGVMLRLMELRQIIGHGHRNSYDLKEEILSKNIFGVDIMPMAVEIARLRAWLSLVLEADYKPADRKNNFGIAALPNLDFKFICANSLIDSGYDDFLSKLQYNLTFFRLDGEIQKLEGLRENYFDPKGDKNRKKELQKEFLKTKDYIKTEFVSLKKSWNLGDFLDKVDDWNPFDDSHPSSFFSPAWMFGIRNGFDVVIGNPPYGANLSKDDIEYFKKTYNLKTSETAILFIEKGSNILSCNGILSYIIPKSFTFSSNYSSTRDYVENRLNIIVDCGKAFEEVKLEACIFQLINGCILPTYNSLRFTENSTFQKLSIIDKSLKKEFGFFPNGLDSREIAIGKKILKAGRFLKDIATNNRGYLLQDNLDNSGDIKVIGGKEIDRYGIRSIKGFTKADSILINKCKIKANSLLVQNIVAHLTNPSDHIKIISCIPKLSNEYAITDTINQIVIKDDNYLPQLIWSILSSTLINWFVYLFIYGKAIRTMHFDNAVTDRIPIPCILTKNQKPFIDRVGKIILDKAQNRDTAGLEKELDVMVYKLYELSYAEVKVIAPDFWLSESEYANFKVE